MSIVIAGHGAETGAREPPPEVVKRVDEVCDRFEAEWKSGKRPVLEDYLSGTRGPERVLLLRELLRLELDYRNRAAERLTQVGYEARFSNDRELIGSLFRELTRQSSESGRGDARLDEAGNETAEALPETIGGYSVRRLLGTGGFGSVYLAYDEQLRRSVAIKVPRRDRILKPADVEAYLAEARHVASLDHPGIVPVHHVGRTDDGLFYVVSKFIEGNDLRAVIQDGPPSHEEAAKIVAAVAEALAYTYSRGLVHRDVKPSNILIDSKGNPHVTDFGLAAKEHDAGGESRYAGTPRYMSPEQVRGEGHRVDGRSDVFSMGVVFYELLTG